MWRTVTLLVVSFAGGYAQAAMASDAFTVTTERGATVHGWIDSPAPRGPGTHPVIVIAPGVGYGSDRPLIRDLAQRAVARGFLAVRFDWQFYHDRADRVDGNSNEIEDLRAVVNYARELSTTDGFFLAGKSLGSIIAYAVAATAAPKALYLLTPVCRSADEFASIYADFTTRPTPTRILVGDADPLCDLSILNAQLGARKAVTPLMVFPGDHSLEVGTDGDSDANIHAALDALAHWLVFDATTPDAG